MNRILLVCYARFLLLYPPAFRRDYGRELQLFVRDYAREHHILAVLLFLFSDLMISLPLEYAKEVRMHLNRRSIAAAAGGAFLLAMAVIMIMQDLQNPNDAMGFFAVLVTCTIGLAGAALLAIMARPSARLLWFVPATYAAAAALWLMLTPVEISDTPSPLISFLFRIGQPAALALLFVPALLALLPIILRTPKHADTIATLLVVVLAVLTTVMLGAYYLPAAVAMALVRFATSASAGTKPAASFV